jgi:hypothetical protein
VGYWIKNQHVTPPGRIALYDLGRGRLLESWRVGPDPGFILFQLEVLGEKRRI